MNYVQPDDTRAAEGVRWAETYAFIDSRVQDDSHSQAVKEKKARTKHQRPQSNYERKRFAMERARKRLLGVVYSCVVSHGLAKVRCTRMKTDILAYEEDINLAEVELVVERQGRETVICRMHTRIELDIVTNRQCC